MGYVKPPATPLPRRMGRIILASMFLIGGGVLWLDGIIILEFRDLCSDAMQRDHPCINREYWVGMTICCFSALVLLLSFCTILAEYWEIKKARRDILFCGCIVILVTALLTSVSYHG